MNPKVKAFELVEWYYCNIPECINYADAKMCAKKTVDEIIESHPEVMCVIKFWQEVKKEIELLK
jgi:hypothetical protein